jgi:hypothetical protein
MVMTADPAMTIREISPRQVQPAHTSATTNPRSVGWEQETRAAKCAAAGSRTALNSDEVTTFQHDQKRRNSRGFRESATSCIMVQ